MTAAEILFSELPGKGGNIGHILLNRPDVLNALNHAMVLAMTKQLKAWQTDSTIKAILIEANGDRAFCAGGDLKNVNPGMEPFFHDEYQLNQLIFHYPKPYIALLDGITMGGGVGISIHGSHRVVTEKVLFAMPETGIGFFPDVGGTYFLPRLPMRSGYYLGLTGARIKSDDCVMLGIAQHHVPRARLADLREMLVNTSFQEDAKATVTNIIQQYSVQIDSSPLLSHLAQLNAWFAYSTVEEIIKTLTQATDLLAAEILLMLQKKSPTSLKIALAALQRGENLSFDDCMKMEYRLVCQFLKEHDFAEGIRAVIIDKDHQPDWQPKTLAEVTQPSIAAYF